MDWDLRPNVGLNTAQAAQRATADRPQADSRGVISYPGYQVAVARRGDTVGSVAARVGLDGAELARYNALGAGDKLRSGEVLALPRRVASSGGSGTSGSGGIIGAPIQSGPIDVTTIASGAIDRASGSAAQTPGWQAGAQSASTAPGVEPVRHKVARGETAFTIARTYNVSARALADWNGLDANMSVREGQFLLIPVATAAAAASAATAPGQGSPTPVPPSASQPLPDEDTATPQAAPAAANLGAQRTGASAARFAMPVNGQIIRGYAKGKNEGIDISASAGTSVQAAADGTVAAITKDTDQVPILVIRHANNLLTVYAGIDNITVAKGATVKRGQTFAKVRAASPAFLHFEVRNGLDSVDPMTYLQ
nr:M23 family metallopeptidase [Rhodobacter sp. SW2]